MPDKNNKEAMQQHYFSFFQYWIGLNQQAEDAKDLERLENNYLSVDKDLAVLHAKEGEEKLNQIKADHEAKEKYIESVRKDRKTIETLRSAVNDSWTNSNGKMDKNAKALKEQLEILDDQYYNFKVDPVKDPAGYREYQQRVKLTIARIEFNANRYLENHSGKLSFSELKRKSMVKDLLKTVQSIKEKVEVPESVFAAKQQQVQAQPKPQSDGLPPVGQNPALDTLLGRKAGPVQQNPQQPQPAPQNPQQLNPQNVQPQPQPGVQPQPAPQNPQQTVPQFSQQQPAVKPAPENQLFKDLPKDAIVINAAGKDDPNNELEFDGDAEMLTVEKYRNQRIAGKDVMMIDRRNEPLFAKEPNFNDIKQGNTGNCYFLAYMSTLAKNNPQALKDMMKDNGNGTVTCRFNNNEGKPVYVTVNKTVPGFKQFKHNKNDKLIPTTKEDNPLWLDMAEKAYMMSGLKPFKQPNANEESEYNDMLSNYKYVAGNPKMSDEQAKKGIFAACFGNVPYSEERFKRMMQHSCVGMSGGTGAILGRHLLGVQSFTKVLNKFDKLEVVNMMAEPEKYPNQRISDMDFDNSLTAEEKQALKHIKQYAAGVLFDDKSKNYKINGGRGYKSFDSVGVEDVVNSLGTAVRKNRKKLVELNPSFKNNPKALDDLAKKYAESVVDFQLKNDGTYRSIPFRTEGKYSKFSENLYNSLQNHIKEKQLVSAGFGRHAYSVLGVREEKLKNGETKKYVTLRNPWGKHGFDPKSGVKFVDLGKKDAEKKGMFDMELNEFVSKIDDLDIDEKTKILTKEDVLDVVAKQYIETFANLYPSKSPEMLKNKCLTDPEILQTVKNSKEVQNIASACFADNMKMGVIEMTGKLDQQTFNELAGLDKEKVEEVQNKIQLNKIKENNKLYRKVANTETVMTDWGIKEVNKEASGPSLQMTH